MKAILLFFFLSVITFSQNIEECATRLGEGADHGITGNMITILSKEASLGNEYAANLLSFINDGEIVQFQGLEQKYYQIINTQIVINIRVHVVSSTQIFNDIDLTTILNHISFMNKVFESGNIKFELKGVNYFVNNVLYQATAKDLNYSAIKNNLSSDNYDSEAINIYYVGKNLSSWATFPESIFTNQLSPYSAVFIDSSQYYNSISTLAHEVGHFLGLFHTFEVFKDQEKFDSYLNPTKNSQVNNNDYAVKFNEFRIYGKHDFIKDTKFDPYNLYFPYGKNYLNLQRPAYVKDSLVKLRDLQKIDGSLKLDTDIVIYNNIPYSASLFKLGNPVNPVNLDLNNLLSYGRPAFRDTLTPGQFTRMRIFIHNNYLNLVKSYNQVSYFQDVELSNEFLQYINGLYVFGVSSGVVSNTMNNLFLPNSYIRRAEMLQFLLRGLMIDVKNTGSDWVKPTVWFKDDVSWNNKWYSTFVDEAQQRNIVNKPNGNNYFYPERNVSRAEATKMIVNGFGLPLKSSWQSPDFPDVDPKNPFYKYIKACQEYGIIKGYPDGKFKPYQAITRAETAKLIYLSITYTGNLGQFLDQASTHSRDLQIIDDPYEPNDNYQSAKPIFSNEEQSHSIHSDADQDWFSFILQKRSVVKINTYGIEEGDLILTVYNSAIQQIYTDDNSGYMNYPFLNKILEPGQYYFKLTKKPGTINVERYYVDYQTTEVSNQTSNSTSLTTLLEAEYFVDEDPGAGYGTPLMANDMSFDEIFEEITGTLSSVGLPIGPHTVFVRFRNSNGSWGDVYGVSINVAAPVGNPQATDIFVLSQPKLAGAEYFLDNDPGAGSGTPLLSSDGTFDEIFEEITGSLSTSTISPGPHTLYIRFKGDNGTWGDVYGVSINVAAPVGNPQATDIFVLSQPKLSGAEYFIDNDPGAGSGTPLLSSDGTFDEIFEEITGSLSTSTISPGPHTLYIRFKGDNGTWGDVYGVSINVAAPVGNPQATDIFVLSQPKLTAGEYFFNNDPGPGAGFVIPAIDGQFDEIFEEFTFEVNQPSSPLPEGVHTLWVRFRNSTGSWGEKFGSIISIDNITPPAAPVGLVATGRNKKVELKWAKNQEDDLSYYIVYRSTLPNFTPSNQDSIGIVNKNDTTYTVTSLNNGTQYHFRLIAVDMAENRSEAGSVASATPGNTAPVIVAQIQNITLIEDSPTYVIDSIARKFSDIDGDSLIFSIFQSNNNLLQLQLINKGLSITPIQDKHGSSLVTLRANDGNLNRDMNFTVTVVPVNDSPILSGLPDISYNEGDSSILYLNRYITDVDSDSTKIDINSVHIHFLSNYSLPSNRLTLIKEEQELETGLIYEINEEYNTIKFKNKQNGTGLYLVEISVKDDSTVSNTDSLQVTVVPKNVISGLILPSNNAKGLFNPVTFVWNSSTRGGTYHLQISTESNFSSFVYNDSSLTDTVKPLDIFNRFTTYYWRVKSANLPGVNPFTETYKFTTLGSTFGITLLSPEHETINLPVDRIKFTWSKASNQENTILYRIEIKKDTSSSVYFYTDSTLVDTSVVVTNFDYDSKYYWRVSSKNQFGWGNSSDWYRFSTIIEKPVKPVLVAPANNSKGIVYPFSLVWNKSNRATKYIVQLSNNVEFNTLTLFDSSLVDTSKIINSLNNYTSHYWRVKAVNEGGESDWSDVFSFKTLGNPYASALEIPLNGALNQNVGNLIFKWRKAEERIETIQKYRFRLASDSLFNNTVLNDSTLNDTVKIVSGLNYDTRYFWQVSASNHAGWGDWSEIFSFRTLENIVVINPAGADTILAETPYTITWQGSIAQTVKIEYTIDGGSTWNQIVSNYPANIGSYIWQVPQVESQYSKIRITGLDNTQIIDETDSFFTIISRRPALKFAGITNYVNEVVNPLQGSEETIFEYIIQYSSSQNNPPAAGYPKIVLDFNGNGLISEPGEGEFTMLPVDLNDTVYSNGKLFSYLTTLPVGNNHKVRFTAVDFESDTAVLNTGLISFRSVPSVLGGLPDAVVEASDIFFSDENPDAGEVFLVTAKVFNSSDMPVENLPVKFYRDDILIGETTIPYLANYGETVISTQASVADPGFYAIVIKADPSNVIIEKSELNNTALRPILIGSTPLTGTIAVNPQNATGFTFTGFYLRGNARYTGVFGGEQVVQGGSVKVTINNQNYFGSTNSLGDYIILIPGLPFGVYNARIEVTDTRLTGVSNSTVNIVNYNTTSGTGGTGGGGGGGGGIGGGGGSVPLAGKDIALTDVFISNVNPVQGEQVSVRVRVGNTGTENLETVLVHFFYANTLLDSAVVNNISVNFFKEVTFVFTVNTSGRNSILAVADPRNQITEITKNNNSISRQLTVLPNKPDLTVTSIVAPSIVKVDRATTITASVRNAGGVSVNTPFEVRFELDGLQIGQRSINQLVAGATANLELPYTFTSTGKKNIKVIADVTGIINESDETNNTGSREISISPLLPNLTFKVKSLINTPPLPGVGEGVDFKVTAKNDGEITSQPTEVKFSVNSTGYTAIAQVPSLTPGQEHLVTSVSQFNPPFEATFISKAEIDHLNTQAELSELDNAMTLAVIVGFGSDLAIDSVEHIKVNNFYAKAGQTVELKALVTNKGSIFTTALVEFYYLNSNQQRIYINTAPVSVSQGNTNTSDIVLFTLPFAPVQILAKIVGSQPQDYDLSNNEMHVLIGDRAPVILLADTLNFDEDTNLLISLNDFVFDGGDDASTLVWQFLPSSNLNVEYESEDQTLNLSAPANYYGIENMSVRVTDPTGNFSEKVITVVVKQVIDYPGKPIPVSPLSNSTGLTGNINLVWNSAENTDKYFIQISTDELFSSVIVSDSSSSDTTKLFNTYSSYIKYYWRVRGINDEAYGDWSTVYNFKTLGNPYASNLIAPLNNSVNQPINGLVFKWTKALERIETIQRYQFQLSIDANFTNLTVNDTTLTDTVRTVNGLSYLSKYYWRVRAANETGWGDWSEVFNLTSIIEKPAVPTALYPLYDEKGVVLPVKFTWKSSQRTETYRLQVSRDANFENIVSDETDLIDTTNQVLGLMIYNEYYWRIKAYNVGGESDWSQISKFKTLGSPYGAYLINPAINTVNQSVDDLVFRWNKAQERIEAIQRYKFQLSSDSTFTTVQIEDSLLTDTVKTLSGLNYLTKYFWRVQAANETGWGDWSEVWNTTTIIEKPTVPVLALPLNNAKGLLNPITTKWSKSLRVERYRLQISTNSNFTALVYNDSTLTDTNKVLPNLTNYTQYYWRVKAYNVGGESDWSAVYNFKTLGNPYASNLIAPLNNSVNQPLNGLVFRWTKAQERIETIQKHQLQVSLDSNFTNLTVNDTTLTDTVGTVNGLSYLSKYYWRVRAANETGWGDWSEVWNTTTIIEKPTVPVLALPLNNAKGLLNPITTKWSKSLRVERYRLQISTNSNFTALVYNDSTITDTTKVLPNSTNYTQYYWRVKAYNVGGESDWSTVYNFKTLGNPYASNLIIPANNTVNQPINGLVFKWTKALERIETIQRYQFQLSLNANFTNLTVNDTTLTDTIRTVNGLSYLTKYYWRVRAANETGWGDWSDVWNTTTIIEKPTVPVLALPLNNAKGLLNPITTKWSKSLRVERYRLQISTNSNFTALVFNDSTITDTTKVLPNLTNYTQYYWRVKAYNVGGESDWSTVYNFKTLGNPYASNLIAPLNNSVNQPINGLVFKWTKALERIETIQRYQFQLSLNANFTNLTVNDTTLTDTIRLVNGLSYLTKYYWRVRAANETGWGDWSDVWNTTTIIEKPTVPVLALPLNNAKGLLNPITTKWSKSLRVERYRLQISTNSNFTALVFNDSTLTDTTKVLPNLTNYTQYYWRVKAYNVGGESDWSTVYNFKTLGNPYASNLISPANNSVNQPINGLVFKWTKALERIETIQRYQFQLSLNANFTNLTVNDTTLTDTIRTVNGLSYLTKYYWRVRAANETGWGDWSEVWNTTTIIEKPTVPVLALPLNDSKGLLNPITTKWSKSLRVERYRLQVSTNSDFTGLVYNDSTITDTTKVLPNLTNYTQYYWRVKSYNVGGESDWSTVYNFKTLGNPYASNLISPLNNTVNQPINGLVFRWTKAQERIETIQRYQFQLSLNANFTNLTVNDTTLTDTTRIVNGLSYLTKYYWRVRAANETGWGDWSDVWNTTTIIEKPTVPVLALPLNNAKGLLNPITTKWSKSLRVERYRLQISTNSNFTALVYNDSTLTDTNKVLPNLTNYTQYYWRVKAYNVGGESDWSTVYNFKTLGNPYASNLIIPANNTVNQPINGLVFRWTKAQERIETIQRYQFQLSLNANFSNLTVNDTTLTDTTRIVNDLSYLTKYYWRVRAANETGWGDWSDVWNTTTIIEKPTVPVLALPLNNAKGLLNPITTKWNKSQRVERYRLQVSTNSDFTGLVYNDSTITDTTKVLPNLTNYTQYYWRVKAYNVGGESDWSTVYNFKTLGNPYASNLISPLNNSVNQPINGLVFRWTKAQERIETIQKYQLQISIDSNFTNLTVNDTTLTDTVRTVNGLSYLNKYYWRVRALNETGWGDWSDVWNFTSVIEKPTVPVLISPINNATKLLQPITLVWGSSLRAEKYRVEVSEFANFSTLLIIDSTVTDTIKVISNLESPKTYYWRVSAINIGGISSYSEVRNFRTLGLPLEVTLISPSNGSVNQPINSLNLVWSTAGEQTFSSVKAPKLAGLEETQEIESFKGGTQPVTPEMILGYTLEVRLDTLNGTVFYSDSTLTDTIKTINGMNNLTAYYWRVRAKNENGWGNWSLWFKYTTIVDLPSEVTLSSPANNSLGMIQPVTLKWRNSLHAEKYIVEVSLDNLFTTVVFRDTMVTDTLKNLPNLEGYKVHYWRVRSSNIAGVSNWSNVWNFKTLGTPTTVNLIHPVNNAVNIPINNVEFIWNRAFDRIETIQNYRFELKTDTTSSSYVINDSTITDTTKVVNGLQNLTNYYWRVSAKNEAGWGGTSSWSKFTTIVTSPVWPILVEPANNAVNVNIRPLFRWNRVNTATRYHLEVSTNNGFTNVIYRDTLLTDTVHVLTGDSLQYKTQYYWRMRAYNAAGVSDFSPVRTFTTLKRSITAPTNLLALSQIVKRVELSWNDNSDNESGFIIYRKMGDSLSTSPLQIIDTASINATAFSDTTIQDTTRYTYRIVAFNLDTVSNPSNYAEVFTVTGVREITGIEIPLEYGLSQNYPNPFNPTTVIRFGLPKVSDVEISIYTINGEYVQTLLNETKDAGYYEVTLEIKEMSSGVYLYRIKAIPHDGSDAFIQVKKLIMMK